MRETLLIYMAVGTGSAIGGVARALLSLGSIAMFGPALPVGTIVANVIGSFLICFYATLSAPGGRLFHRSWVRQFVMGGFCGGFTTFSVFSLETMMLMEHGHRGLAAANVGISIASWLLAAWIGYALAARLNRLGGS